MKAVSVLLFSLISILLAGFVSSDSDAEHGELDYDEDDWQHGFKQKLKNITNKCSETNATPMINVALLITGNGKGNEEDKSPKCWLACVMKESDLMITTGTDVSFDVSKMKQEAKEAAATEKNQSKLTECIDKCATVSANGNSDPCEMATRITVCMWNCLKRKESVARRQGE